MATRREAGGRSALGAVALAATCYSCTQILGFEDDYQVASSGSGSVATTASVTSSASTTGSGGAGGVATSGGGGEGGTPSTCAHSVCEPGPALADGCEPCATTVCNADSYCCMTSWDLTCVDIAADLCENDCCGEGMCLGNSCTTCPEDCGDCTCPHTVCAAGAALSGALCREPCHAEVCATMPSCCGAAAWEKSCIDQAVAICGPSQCVTDVCAADPLCCTDGWGAACVTLAQMLCTTQCDCSHSICAPGPALVATCDPCVAAICDLDSVCCSQTWDPYCVVEVQTVCGITC